MTTKSCQILGEDATLVISESVSHDGSRHSSGKYLWSCCNLGSSDG